MVRSTCCEHVFAEKAADAALAKQRCNGGRSRCSAWCATLATSAIRQSRARTPGSGRVSGLRDLPGETDLALGPAPSGLAFDAFAEPALALDE